MLRFTTLFAFALFASAPAHAQEKAPVTSKADGYSFEYTSELKDEMVLIKGVVLDNGESFSLRIQPSGRIRGEFGGRPVSFSIRKAERDRLAARLKASELALADAGAR